MFNNTNRCFDNSNEMDMPNPTNNVENVSMGCPTVGPIQERCVHRTFVHEVPHVCPIRTRVINHHKYVHTYKPEYTCCEENVVENVNCGSCNQFR
ncbi:MAG: hypothetical protein RR359_02690 [Bacilli bacterium]